MSNTLIFLADGFEEVEALTVVDLLRRAGISVRMVSMEDGACVTGSHAIAVRTDLLYAEADFAGADMLILPGGMPGTKNLLNHEGLCGQIRSFHREGKMLAAICAAPSVLGKCGVLDKKRAACYPGYEDQLAGAEVLYDPVVCDGNIITSRGAGTAILFSAAIIARYKGEQEAERIKEALLYV